MDKKTKILLIVEALLIVILVVVVAVDYNEKPQKPTAVTHEATEAAAAPAQDVKKEPAEKTEKKEAVETPVAKADEPGAKPAAEKPKEAKKPAVEKSEPKAEAKEKAAPTPAKKEAPAKASSGGGTFTEIIAMNNPAYDKHTKTIVQFTHKKHAEEYKATCGDCHHNEAGEPLKDLKMGDSVTPCIECHSKAGKAPKPEKGQPELTAEQKREYHSEALHDNCIGCHKEFNAKNNTKAGPVTCAQCHPKDK